MATVKKFSLAAIGGHCRNPTNGHNFSTGRGGTCAGSKAKICAKYAQKNAQNMRNPKMGLGIPIPYHPSTFVTKYGDIYVQEEVLMILRILKAPFYFFRKILVF